jgi:hypothetical protein
MALTGDTLDFVQGGVVTSSAQIVDNGATTGHVLTVQADKSIAAAPGGGSQPGALQVAEMTFAQVAGGGHTYTATAVLPALSRLLWVEISIITDWETPPDDAIWNVGDEQAADNIMSGLGLGLVGSDAATSTFKDGWKNGNPQGSGQWSNNNFEAKEYLAGQTITAVATDTTGGTGTGAVRLYYFVAPTQHAAVVS